MEVYCSWELGDVKVIVLDVRYCRQRAHPDKPQATLLGKDQEEWLREELDHNKKYTMIASGSCIKDGAKRETWRDFKNFYADFRQQIKTAERTLFVSGDIHRNKFNDHKGFFEAISSGIGRKEKLGNFPNQKTGKPLNNYGIVTFGKSSVRVSLRGRRKRDRIEKRIRASSWTLIE